MPSPRPRAAAARPLLALLLNLVLGLSAAPHDGVDEYALKAAFLGKFVKYVIWPAENGRAADAPFVVGVFGSDPFGARIDDAFRDKRVGSHPVAVRRFHDASELAGARMLFVPAAQAARLAEIREATRSGSVLLIGEAPDFAAHGGVINFYLEGTRLRFEINVEAAARESLKISSDLLKLARIVARRD